MQYDAELRHEEPYCINCGARPRWKPQRADGQPIEAPMMCRKCEIRPRHREGLTEYVICSVCRIDDIIKNRRLNRKTGASMGNFRHKGVLMEAMPNASK